MKLIYVCGPYRAKSAWECEQNVRRAEGVARRLAEAGYMPVCPHANTRPYFEGIQPDEFWLEGTLELMRRCDGIALVEGWQRSEGASAEYQEALRLGKELLPLSYGWV